MLGLVFDIRRRRDHAAVSGRGRDGTGIHQRYRRDLALTGLGSFPIGEIAGGMTEGQSVVGGHVARTEARSAEGGFDHRTRLKQRGAVAVAGQFQRYGNGGGVHGQREISVAAGRTAKNVRRLIDILIDTAGASGNDALIGVDFAVLHLGYQIRIGLGEFRLGFRLDLRENLLGVLDELVDRIRIGGVERQGDHGLHLGQIDLDHGVVIRHLAGLQFFIIRTAAVGLVELLHFLIGFPNGGQTRSLRGHHVDTAAEIGAEGFQTGANELQHLVFHKSILKGSTHKGNRHVVRSDTPAGRARHVHQHHLRRGNIPGVLQQLLRQFGSALTHAHGTESTVAGVAVGAQDHTAALGQLLSCK